VPTAEQARNVAAAAAATTTIGSQAASRGALPGSADPSVAARAAAAPTSAWLGRRGKNVALSTAEPAARQAGIISSAPSATPASGRRVVRSDIKSPSYKKIWRFLKEERGPRMSNR